MRIFHAVLLCPLAVASVTPAAAAPSLFAAAQARTGQAMYAQYCQSCHGAALQGIPGPALAGPDFARASDHYTLGLIFEGLTETTPAGAPASLTRTEYTDIMAYILAKNGYQSGPTRLTYQTALHSPAPFFAQGQ